MTSELYLDANATSPVLPAASDAACEAMRAGFGNPSSTHATGLRARALLDDTRARARRVLGAPTGRLMFTSGATEGIQTAILSALCAQRARVAEAPLLLYGATEHKAVPEALAHWNRVLGTGFELRALPVDADGRHRLDVLRELAPRAALVCTMAANNETGVISDLDGIGTVLGQCAPHALWLVDGVQALGKLPLALASSRIDYAPFSGHKLYAPKGVGMLYVRAGAPFTPLMMGGGQEGGDRSGTENMTGIAALGAVLRALEEGDTFRGHAELAALRDRLVAALRAAFPGILFNAPFEHALPTTINFTIPDVSSRELLELFDAAGIRVSSGSACSSAKAAPSHVLDAMGLPAWRAGAAVRMSFGPAAGSAFIDAACERIARCGAVLRRCGLGTPGAGALAPAALTQVAADGHVAWLLRDARGCVLVDPVPALVPRLAALAFGSAVPVRAIVATAPSPAFAAARAELERLLDARLDRCGSDDPLGWPTTSDCVVTLDAGMLVNALDLGEQVLARLPQAEGEFAAVAYLLGGRSGAALPARAVRHAFCGTAMRAGDAASLRARLAACVHAHAIVCGSAASGAVPCTTLAAESGAGAARSSADGRVTALVAGAPPVPHLDVAALERFLGAHPGALLVDVREPHEFLAGPAPAWHGSAAVNVPLSQLAARLPDWLGAPARALVFFCRSGNRSAQAVQCLQRLGHADAWQLTGGLALASAA